MDKDNLSQLGCLGIYAGGAALWKTKGNSKLFLGVLGLHAAEYFVIGKKVGATAGISDFKTAVNCLLYGYTWWLPLKNSLNQKTNKYLPLEPLINIFKCGRKTLWNLKKKKAMLLSAKQSRRTI